MSFFKKYTKEIGAAVIILLGLYVYLTYFSGSSTPALSSNDTVAASQSLLVVLQNLHTITLDDKIFSDPVYLSLSDFGVPLPKANPGRANPFIPVSGAATSTQGTH